MTPQERAEKIVSQAPEQYTFSGTGLKEAIAAQIEEAEREAREEGGRQAAAPGIKSLEDSYTKGFSAAREKAKGILEDEAFKADCSAAEHSNDILFAANKQGAKKLKMIADRIAKMEPEK